MRRESDVDVYPLDAGEMAEAGEVVVTDEGMVPENTNTVFVFVFCLVPRGYRLGLYIKCCYGIATWGVKIHNKIV